MMCDVVLIVPSGKFDAGGGDVEIGGDVNESYFAGPDDADLIGSDGVTFYGLALDGNNNQSIVEMMNSDDCFRHFLLNTNDDQLISFLNQAANNLNREFPAGTLTNAEMLVADPAFGGDPVHAANWTRGAYHGTVIWSWHTAVMAGGLERQLAQCDNSTSTPACVLMTQCISMWRFGVGEYMDGGFEVVLSSDIPAPGGIPQTESIPCNFGVSRSWQPRGTQFTPEVGTELDARHYELG
ncbi:hypothetical protein SAICODRAFT_7681 [Saitoella complicata NRRL Y-17804]|uniref:uncharacterized protein n=1 Tax=Saitoella complicata (strain BCRC 22490 / CBS 7301 / JCM 7358 / NBRC 10748 / NRRL Y-17804) TaxID=698492 RepID=UPI000866D20E|nr:uncharacterized protein SAICODRAFT_7681 [Saitoella complicata NRRL Y-17804]ODQ52638.1 hypothetical protein SAICODRAFT_7681 [Saitoella complicata NRRL Y-17804]